MATVLRPEYTIRENLPLFPLEEGGWKFDYDQHTPLYIMNIPENEDFAFGASSSYKRCGNFLVTFKRIQHKGTLYVGDDGEWLLVSRSGLISASGSKGSISLTKPKETVINTMQYKSNSRFDDIIGFD
jgi:hypothetical protein